MMVWPRSSHSAPLAGSLGQLPSLTRLIVQGWLSLLGCFLVSPTLAQQTWLPSVAEQAKGAWESGATERAIELLDDSLRQFPDDLALAKLRGDILSTTRRSPEAIEAYDLALAAKPSAMDVRWAKWSVLVRGGLSEEAMAELEQLAKHDPANPLVYLRIAQELRKLDRIEDSLTPYQRAIALAPTLLSWRLALARTRFDLTDYLGAEKEVEEVLRLLPPGSPFEVSAKNLLTVIYASADRGRRSDPVGKSDVSESQRRDWAAIRADAWRLFAASRYAEAEPIYRQVLALNPKDVTAAHQFGITLMKLGRCKEALTIFRTVGDLDPSDEEYADTVYRMGQCFVDLGRWEEAFVHFQILYEAAAEFEEANKGVPLPPDTRVLDKTKLSQWLDRIRPQVPDLERQVREGAAKRAPFGESDAATKVTEEEFYKRVLERLKPQRVLDARASLMGRDADFSRFRFVIAAHRVMRDDLPTGTHEFIPLEPSDTFPSGHQDIYLVFGLVSDSYEAVPLSAQCHVEAAEVTGESLTVAQDRVVMGMSDQSGYFRLTAPLGGWTAGLYRCGLFEGEGTSAYNHVDEIRFRILAPTKTS